MLTDLKNEVFDAWKPSRRAVIRRKYLENADVFHRKVAEGKEPWVMKRTPDDAGAMSDPCHCCILQFRRRGTATFVL